MSLMEWIKKDFIIIIVCLVAVLVCIFSYFNASIILEQCNSKCVEQFNEHCSTGFVPVPYINDENLPALNLSNWGDADGD